MFKLQMLQILLKKNINKTIKMWRNMIRIVKLKLFQQIEKNFRKKLIEPISFKFQAKRQTDQEL